MHVRHCPACRTDYRPDIVTCADCGALLEDRDDELELPDDKHRTHGEQPDGSTSVLEGFEPLLRAGYARDLTLFADRLIEAGIECRMREALQDAHVTGYQVLVHGGDRTRALEAVTPLVSEGVGVALLDAGGDGFDPTSGYARCPSCNAELAPSASVCPECQLPLREADVACPECGEALDSETRERCGNCGHRLVAAE